MVYSLEIVLVTGTMRVEHQVFQSELAQFSGQVVQPIHVGSADGKRDTCVLRQLAHGLPVLVRGCVQQRTSLGGFQPSLCQFWRRSDQDQGPVAGCADRANSGGEFGGISGGCLNRKPVQVKIDADVIDGEVVGRLYGFRDRGRILRIDHPQEESRLMVERFLVPEEDRFVADGQLAISALDFDQADRRGGSGFELFGCLRSHVRAILQFRLLGGELHRKRQAGRETAVLAIGLREHFVDLKTRQCHQLPPHARRRSTGR